MKNCITNLALFLSVVLAVKGIKPTAGETVTFEISNRGGTIGCISAGSDANGAEVTIESCDESEGQEWTVVKGGNTAGQLQVYGNKCLDVTDGQDKNGNKLQIWTCGNNGGNKNQQWKVNAGENRAGTIQWDKHSRCVDLTDGRPNAGNQLQIWNCGNNNNINQQWDADSVDDPTNPSNPTNPTNPSGTALIPKSVAGLAEDICFGADSLENGAPVTVVPCDISNTEYLNIWLFPNDITIPTDPTDYSGRNAFRTSGQIKLPLADAPAKCLDVTDGKDENGTKLQLWDCGSGTNKNQQFVNAGYGGVIRWTGGKSGKARCVDLTEGDTTAGNQLQIWSCSSSSTPYVNQQWIYEVPA